jgi:hypothetical protein
VLSIIEATRFRARRVFTGIVYVRESASLKPAQSGMQSAQKGRAVDAEQHLHWSKHNEKTSAEDRTSRPHSSVRVLSPYSGVATLGLYLSMWSRCRATTRAVGGSFSDTRTYSDGDASYR